MSAKAKSRPVATGGFEIDCVCGDAPSLNRIANNSKGAAVILDRERIRDGMRKGQPTAAFVLTLDSRIVWRGFSRDRAIEAAKSWTDQGTAFLDKTGESRS